jgi:hypothetical protein
MDEDELKTITKFRKNLNVIYQKKINKCEMQKILFNDSDELSKNYIKYLNLEIQVLECIKIIKFGYESLLPNKKIEFVKKYKKLIHKLMDDVIVLSKFYNDEVYKDTIEFYYDEYKSVENFEKKDLNKMFKNIFINFKKDSPVFLEEILNY